MQLCSLEAQTLIKTNRMVPVIKLSVGCTSHSTMVCLTMTSSSTSSTDRSNYAFSLLLKSSNNQAQMFFFLYLGGVFRNALTLYGDIGHYRQPFTYCTCNV